MYQAMLEDGVIARNGAIKLVKPLQSVRIPTTVQGVLAARIDRLPADAKELLQTLSVIGREFPLSLIWAVLTRSDDELNRMLNDLQLGEFIYEQPALGDTEFIFKHALTQEVVYNSVLIERRKLLHERTGEVIETLFAGRLDGHLNELARHYSRSSNIAKAVVYLHLTGQQAARRSAHAEAVAHLGTGLKLLKSLPDDPERARREFNLQFALAESLRWTIGLAAEEVGRALIRARELCKQVGENTKIFAVLHGLFAHQQVRRSEPNTARDLAEQLLTLAEADDDPDKLMIAHGVLGIELFTTGEFAAALTHLEQASPNLDWSRTSPFGAFYPCWGAWVLWALGYSDRAQKWSREALAMVEALSRPEQLASALSLTAILHMFMRDPHMAHEYAEAAIATTNLPFEIAHGSFVRGWALAQHGRLQEGVAQMRHAMAVLEALGFALRPRLFCLLAEAHGKIEGPTAALEVLTRGIASTEVVGERSFEAEMQRMKGELLLMQGAPNAAEAESCFRSAIEVARNQGGKALELRSTTSLGRLLRDTNRRDEARKMLAEIYGWFTEGFDTADLKEAKSLLDELSN
jgi:tetratricopeptide (TPR) repeat protein